MSDADHTSETLAEPRLLFSSEYGGFPRFIWFAVIPLLLFASAALFVDARWFDGRFLLTNARMSPNFVLFVICPCIWGLCALFVVLEIYRQRNPQFILVSTWGVRLPKGRFTAENIPIAWDDLHVTLEGTNFKGWQVYEFQFEGVRNGERSRVTSMLFRKYSDFARFATVLGEQIGREWPIKGVPAETARSRKAARH